MMRTQKAIYATLFCALAMAPVWAQKKQPNSGGRGQGSAAKIEVTWGEEYDMPKHHTNVGFLGNAKDGFVEVLAQGMKSMILKKFSADLKTTGMETVNLDDMPDGAMTETFVTMKNNTWWIYSAWDRDAHMESLHARKMNLKALSVGTDQKLLESPHKLVGGAMVGFGIPIGGMGYGKYNFNFSSDSSKLMVSYTLKPEEKKDSKSYEIDGMFVFDENMKKVNGGEFTMPRTEAMMDNDDYEVDGNGNMYMVSKVYEEERKESKDKTTPNYHFEIAKYAPGTKKPQIIPFALENGFAKSILLVDDSRGNVYCSGFYSKTVHGPTTGAFMLKLEAGKTTFSKYQKGYYDFPVDVLKSFESARTQAKIEKKEEQGKDVGSARLTLRDFLIRPDGSVTIVGEEYWMEVYYTYNNGHMEEHRKYHYNDIYAMTIDASGALLWVKKIPKTQTGSSGVGGMSYKFFVKGSDMYLFYLDNAKNATLSVENAPAAHTDGLGGILICIKVEASGKDSRTVLFDSREVEKRITPTALHIANSNTLISTAAYKKQRTIYSITVN